MGVSSPRRYLDLKGTLGVTGTLPPELFGSKMSELIAVRAKYSSLSGTLPASIFELPRLDRLYIGGSRKVPLLISGTILLISSRYTAESSSLLSGSSSRLLVQATLICCQIWNPYPRPSTHTPSLCLGL